MFTSQTAFSCVSAGNHIQCFRCHILSKLSLSHLYKVWLKRGEGEGGTQCASRRQSCFPLAVSRLVCRWSFTQYRPIVVIDLDCRILIVRLVWSFLLISFTCLYSQFHCNRKVTTLLGRGVGCYVLLLNINPSFAKAAWLPCCLCSPGRGHEQPKSLRDAVCRRLQACRMTCLGFSLAEGLCLS